MQYHHELAALFLPWSAFFGMLFLPLVILVLVWSIGLKGLALWHAARNHQTAWFIVLLIVNTLGILELIYLFGFRKDRHTNPLFGHARQSDTTRTPPASSSPAA